MSFDLSVPLHTLTTSLHQFFARLPLMILALVAFLIFCLVARTLRRITISAISRRARHGNIGLLIGRLVQGLTVFAGLLIAISIVFPSVKAQNIVELFGIGSVAIGFAFRDILQNFLAGILILINEPFVIGDRIQVRDFKGAVKDIQARATLIQADDDRLIVVPNAVLFTESVTVFQTSNQAPASAATSSQAHPSESV